MTITVIDYGRSNLLSVERGLVRMGAQVVFARTPEAVRAAKALVLPGVGAFADGMAGLAELGLIEPIRAQAADGVPLLGICLGMQMLFDESDEFGRHPGLGLIPGRVEKIPAQDADGEPLRVPNIGWRPLYPAGAEAEGLPGAAGAPLDFSGTALARVTPGQECYFVHSFAGKPLSPAHRLADTVYGGRRICAAACSGSVLGTQFHPEKSGPVGLSILAEFLRLAGAHS